MVLGEWKNPIYNANNLKQVCKDLETQLHYLHLRNMELERLLAKSQEDLDEKLLEHQVTEKLLDQHKDTLAEAHLKLQSLSKTIQTQSIALVSINEERQKLLDTLCERDRFIIKLNGSNNDCISIYKNETPLEKHERRGI